MLKLAGKGVLLIGTRRVGAVVARRLAREKMAVAIGYRSSEGEAKALAADLRPEAAKVALVKGDVTQEADVKRMVAEAAQSFGGLFFVVNLAAAYPRATFGNLDAKAWDNAMGDARGSYLLAVEAARAFEGNPGPTRGHIILFTDWAALQTPYRDYLPYLTAKASIDFMTRAFAVELAPRGVLVNAIAPGPTMRPPEVSVEEWEKDVVARAPLRRESSAEEIAEVVTSLLRSETITGVTIRVDSGRHLAGPGG